MRWGFVALWIGLLGSARAQPEATREVTHLRTANAKFYETDEERQYLAVYHTVPVHKLEDGEFVNMTPEEIQAPPSPPSGKPAATLGYEWWIWAANGGRVAKKPDGSYIWDNSDRGVNKWLPNNYNYRTIFSFWTPMPSGATATGQPTLAVWRDTPHRTYCGTDVRHIRSTSVPGGAEEMYDWIASGVTIASVGEIAKPQLWSWPANTAAGRELLRYVNDIGSVHLGLKGHSETHGGPPCSLGRWGTDDAPEWPIIFVDVDEPNTYSALLVYVLVESSKPVAWEGPDGIRPDGWGHLKWDASH